ncbi:MAG: hypothetical protein HYY17_14445 [Planctomycetes bacterium]|nr:hypothetical protein [Planctomycetota bacterium]
MRAAGEAEEIVRPAFRRDILREVDLRRLFKLVDAKPFRTFEIGLMSGERVLVDHPENVFFLPNRTRVMEIIVYVPEPYDYSLVYPEGITALHVMAKAKRGGNGGAR